VRAVLLVVDDVDGRLFGGRAAPVDADVGRQQVRFVVHVHALVGRDQPARAVVADLVLLGEGLGDVGAGIFIVELHRRVGFLLGEKLVQGLVVAGFLPLLRRRVALVQDVVDATVDEGVLLGKLIVVIGAVQTCRFFWGFWAAHSSPRMGPTMSHLRCTHD
jgi:hypothetical protein